MANDPRKQDDGDVLLKPRKEPKLEKARRYQVVFYNDHYTTKWFVVDVLERFFHMSEASATAFMMTVHTHGRGVAGVYSRDIAETKVAEVTEYAREFEMPLKVTAEPEDERPDE
jgi:ATP-dependent Clp protease adaptor protein ClpS